jgi:2-succinyl-5-enolpyruvyl-6-hydroxy-3-cyclohexene-1-carboxylate synthase
VTAAAANRRDAAALLETFAALGVRDVIVSPGSRSTPLVLVADALPALRTHVVLDERAAAFVALGIAKASGRPAILVCTSGSAGAHYLPALVEASEAGVPLIALTADRPAELHHGGAPQTTPQRALFADYVRWSADTGTGANDPGPTDTRARWLARLAAIATDRASADRPGPVHLNVPFPEPLWDPTADPKPGADPASTALLAPAPVPARILRPAATAATAAPDAAGSTTYADILDALAPLLAAPRGLVVCGPALGAGAQSDGLAAEALALAAHLGWPLLADPASGLRFGDAAGATRVTTYDALADAAPEALPRPDAVLRFGRVPTSKAAARWLAEVGRDRTVCVDPSGAWQDPDLAASVLVAAEPAAFCPAARRATAPRSAATAAWLAAWANLEAHALGALEGACTGSWSGAFVRAHLAARPDHEPLFVSSSLAIRDLDRFGQRAQTARRPVFANRGVNGIDGIVATAAGVALASGPVSVLLGDLALLHDLDGVCAAVALGAPLTLVVVDNGGGGIFRQLPISGHPTAFERYFVTPQPQRIPAVCEGLGLPCRTVETPSALTEALAAPHTSGPLTASPGPRAVHVRLDPNGDAAGRARARAALRAALAGLPTPSAAEIHQ